METLLRTRDVASRLACSVQTVMNHIHRGELRAVCVGARKGYRVPEREVAAFLERREIQPQADVRQAALADRCPQRCRRGRIVL